MHAFDSGDNTPITEFVPPTYSGGIDTFEVFSTFARRPLVPGAPLGVTLHKSPQGGVYVKDVGKPGGKDTGLLTSTGLRPHDVLYHINGVDVSMATVDDVVRALRSPPKSSHAIRPRRLVEESCRCFC